MIIRKFEIKKSITAKSEILNSPEILCKHFVYLFPGRGSMVFIKFLKGSANLK